MEFTPQKLHHELSTHSPTRASTHGVLTHRHASDSRATLEQKSCAAAQRTPVL